MNEFTFEATYSPWELALSRLKPGDVFSARRFLTLMRSSGDVSPEDAALELESRGVMLDVTDLPAYAGNPDTAARMALEQRLMEQGSFSQSLDEKDSLRLFLEEIAQMTPVEDGTDLAMRAREGSQKAAEQLTNGYLHVVVDCAREYMGRGVLLGDLLMDGCLGLCHGVEAYEGGDFRPHARWWICQAMARSVTLQAEEDGVGDHLAERLDACRNADKRLLDRLGRGPTEEELALELGITVEETRSLQKMLREVREMARIKQENQPQETPEEEDLSVEDTAYYQARERVSDLMSGLTQQETMILNLRYGLNGKAPLSVQETAAKLNMTAAEITAAEAGALEKLRRSQ